MFNPNDFSELFEKSMEDPKLEENITGAEEKKLAEAFLDPKFEEMFSEFAREMNTKEGRQDIEQEIEEAEKLAAAESVVQTIKDERKPTPQVGSKQAKTAWEKAEHEKEEHGIKVMERELQKKKEEEAKTVSQMRNLEQLYAQSLKQGRASQEIPPTESSQNADEQGMTEADLKKLQDLVCEVDELKADVGPKPAPPTEWPNRLSFIQNVDYADFVESERINMQATRGADKIRLEVGIPENVDPERIQLEIERLKITLTHGDYVFSKEMQQPLIQKSARATLAVGKTFNLPNMLVIEAELEKDQTAIFSDFRKQIQQPKHYETKEIDENEVDKLAEQISAHPTPAVQPVKESLIVVPEDVERQSQGWKQQSPKPVVQASSAPPETKTFEALLRQQMEEKRKVEGMKIEDIEQDLEQYEKIGISFTLRGKCFNFYNGDLVEELQ